MPVCSAVILLGVVARTPDVTTVEDTLVMAGVPWIVWLPGLALAFRTLLYKAVPREPNSARYSSRMSGGGRRVRMKIGIIFWTRKSRINAPARVPSPMRRREVVNNSRQHTSKGVSIYGKTVPWYLLTEVIRSSLSRQVSLESTALS